MASTQTQPLSIITPAELLAHWQGHRGLTRRVIEAFPEDEFFTFSIGSMRTGAGLMKELLSIGAPGLEEIVTGVTKPFSDDLTELTTKAQFLEKWDEDTDKINMYWSQLSDEKFRETNNLFGQYNFPVIDNIHYFIDNEIHHRGQAYVYLRALGIEPPYFWER